MQKYIRIHGADSVAVALEPLLKGDVLEVGDYTVTLKEDVPQGHKFALYDLHMGDEVIKYGNPIGSATKEISAGEWIHTHNLKTGLISNLSYTYDQKLKEIIPQEGHTFQGYRRKDGSVGVRNEIWLIPTVGCVNSVLRAVEKKAQRFCTGSIEEIVSFPHPYGCSQMGDDQEDTRRILADLIQHPNAGGVLVMGLGCENSNIMELKKYLSEYDPQRVRFLVAQETADEVGDALKIIEELAAYANSFQREPIPVSELVVGLKCGGSDGLSGITANPLVGEFSDLLIAEGGTTILTEVPEMFGAEMILMNRCKTKELFQKTVDMVEDFKEYYTSHNLSIYENPSPGNKAGGISTLEDKSLGCTQKSGSAPVSGVLSYGEKVTGNGLMLLSAPGNDLVAATALASSGAQIVLFTTGRGTPFASPVPTIKIASNTKLAEEKSNWIDFNAGSLVSGKDMQELAAEFFAYVIEVASGRQVCAELAGYHDMAIFKKGVTL
ncbi:MAG: UxaA family hydrolase [Lachnospiraceae bacterium]